MKTFSVFQTCSLLLLQLCLSFSPSPDLLFSHLEEQHLFLLLVELAQQLRLDVHVCQDLLQHLHASLTNTAQGNGRLLVSLGFGLCKTDSKEEVTPQDVMQSKLSQRERGLIEYLQTETSPNIGYNNTNVTFQWVCEFSFQLSSVK